MGPDTSVWMVRERTMYEVSNHKGLPESYNLPILRHKGDESILAACLDDSQPEFLKELALRLEDGVFRFGALRRLSRADAGMDVMHLVYGKMPV